MASIILVFPGLDRKQFLEFNKERNIIDLVQQYNNETQDDYIQKLKQYYNDGNMSNIVLANINSQVRLQLALNDIRFYLVYPAVQLKNTIIERIKNSNELDEDEILKLQQNWDKIIEDLDLQFYTLTQNKIKINNQETTLKDVIRYHQ